MGVILRKERVAQTNPFMGAKVEPSKIKKKIPIEFKGKFDTQSIRNHDIKSMFGSVVAVAFQITFHVEMHANDFFYFLKTFLTSAHQNDPKHTNHFKF